MGRSNSGTRQGNLILPTPHYLHRTRLPWYRYRYPRTVNMLSTTPWKVSLLCWIWRVDRWLGDSKATRDPEMRLNLVSPACSDTPIAQLISFTKRGLSLCILQAKPTHLLVPQATSLFTTQLRVIRLVNDFPLSQREKPSLG